MQRQPNDAQVCTEQDGLVPTVAVGVGEDVATQRKRNIRSYTIEKARSAVQNRIDGQRAIELCNQRIENTLAEFNQDDINEMIYILCTRWMFLFCFVVIIMKFSSTWLFFLHFCFPMYCAVRIKTLHREKWVSSRPLHRAAVRKP